MRKDSIAGLTIALTVTSALCAAVLAAAAHATRQPIAEAKAAATAEALRSLEPDFDNNPSAEAVPAKSPSGAEALFYPIKKAGVLTAVIAKSVGAGGYGGGIETLFSMTPEGVVKQVLVTSHKETPGLGTVVTDRVAQKTIGDVLDGKKAQGLPPNKFLDQFGGKSFAPDGAAAFPGAIPASKWRVRKDGGALDEVTGATVSSRAVVGGVREALAAFHAGKDAIIAAFRGDGAAGAAGGASP